MHFQLLWEEIANSRQSLSKGDNAAPVVKGPILSCSCLPVYQFIINLDSSLFRICSCSS